MTNRILLLLGLLAAASVARAADRPNVIVAMADDLGFECIACNGSEHYQTPHVDALAASGMRFVNAHSQPICTPSRVQIMTGIYNNRNYVKFGYLDPEETTFANLMRDDGYQTAIAGKWQLMGGYEGVKNFGFDRHCLWQLNRRPSRYPNPGLEIDGEEKDFKDGSFGPYVVHDYVDAWLGEAGRKDAPFLLYYPMIQPHWPFVPTPGSDDWDPDMWKNKKNEPGGYHEQKYWDLMVEMTDDTVGRLVASLEKHGLRENTLVIWTCDNGTYTGITSPFNGRQFRGGKGGTPDSGTHVPFIASWPAKIEAGVVKEELVDFSDILPTVCEVAGVEVPSELDIDGHSLVPLLTGKGPSTREYIYCWYSRDGKRESASQHVRDARYKLYATGKFFDVVADPNEKSAITVVPEELMAVYARLEQQLAPHLEVTLKADPIQQAKRDGDKKKQAAEKDAAKKKKKSA